MLVGTWRWRAAEVGVKVDLESAVGWGYEGNGVEAGNGKGPRRVEMWHHGENV